MLPDSVLYDVDLSASGVRVYCELAGSVREGNVFAKIGQRLIARKLGMHQETVGKALHDLCERGHIMRAGKGLGRHKYILMSDAFGKKQEENVETVRIAASGGVRLTTVDTEKPLSTVRTRFPKPKKGENIDQWIERTS